MITPPTHPAGELYVQLDSCLTGERTGFVAAATFLLRNRYEISAAEGDVLTTLAARGWRVQQQAGGAPTRHDHPADPPGGVHRLRAQNRTQFGMVMASGGT